MALAPLLFLSILGQTQTATIAPAWLPAEDLPPPRSAPAPTPPPTSSRLGGSAFTLRAQGGFASGVPGGSGGGLALVGGLMLQERVRVELSGRYRLPRTARFPTTAPYAASVSLTEVGIRGCLELDFRAFQVPACLGMSGGRWKANTLGGTPEADVAKLWVGANAGLALLWVLDEAVALFAGIQGDVSLVRPELALDPTLGITPLRPTRFGTLAEAGVEVRFW
ncbi:MAG: hypothetical protein KC933_03300 [Myxococcales bacterium]|nr:hypothetical protein [Myxococcales bacterium]MCB9647997.1 hypothetical protein [Deltaproteobacteria bacterium]